MTLDDVARACDPPTTPQTIGRLETGTRTVSVGWLNRIAKALSVEAQDLVEGGETAELKVAAILGPGGAMAPRKASIVVPPHAADGQVAILVGAMALTIFYGVLKLRQMQEDYDARLPAKEPK